MNTYTNFAHLPHTLTIIDRSSGQVILKKKFDSENDAVLYLEEAREFKKNKKLFSFTIIGA